MKVVSQGEPNKTFEITPESADFDKILAGDKGKYEFELKNIGAASVELVVAAAPTDEFVRKFKIKKDILKPGQSTKIEIELRTDLDMGAFKTALTLEAKNDPASRFSIPITGTVVDELDPKPQVSRAPAPVVPAPKKPEAKVDISPENQMKAIATNKMAAKINKPKRVQQIKPGIIRDDSDLK